jgi:hypothetical protein
MNSILVAALTLCVLLLLVLIFLLRKLTAGTRNISPTPEAPAAVPIEDRLGADDFEFLAQHPAVSRTFVNELRRERRKVFRAYLRALRKDFNQVCELLGKALAESGEDRKELAAELFRQRAMFLAGILRAEFLMTLEVAGLATLEPDIELEHLSQIRGRLDELRLALEGGV